MGTRLIAVLVAVAALAPQPASAAHRSLPSLEADFLARMNRGRAEDNDRGVTSGLVAHAGLREQARHHADRLRADGSLHHQGFDGRMDRAAPDPAESNGAPDDGFVDACENVGYHQTSADSSPVAIVEALYVAFRDSPKHRTCMFDEGHAGYTVAGVGFVEEDRGNEGVRYWVVIEIAEDRSVPGQAHPTAQPEPAPTPAPAAHPPPATAPPAPVTPSPQAPPPVIAEESAPPTVAPTPLPTPDGRPPESPLSSRRLCLSARRSAHTQCVFPHVGPSAIERELA